MTTLPDRLNTHLAKMAAGDITDSTTHRLMALLRQLLEERNERGKYPILAMFCDWSLHVKLDRSKDASTLDLLERSWTSGNADEDIANITKLLNVQRLRDEMVSLLASAFINPTALQDDQRAAIIMDHLLAELADKPITRRPQQIEKLKAERLGQGHRFMAVKLFFSLNDDKEHTPAKYVLKLGSVQIEPASGGNVNIVIPWPLLADPAGTIRL